jgi:uncharacterized membrane protein
MLRQIVALIWVAALAPMAFADTQFAISPLGDVPVSGGAMPALISNSQVIVGIATVGEPGARTPFFLSGGVPVPFSPPPVNSEFSPEAVNASGIVAGFLITNTSDPSGPSYSAVAYQNGHYLQLQPPGVLPADNFRAEAINGAGEIVGFTQEGNGLGRAVTWINQQPAFLDPNPAESSVALAVNDNGWIAGSIGSASGVTASPVIWHGGATTNIPLPADATFGTAVAINDGGQVLVNYATAGTIQNPSENRLLLWNNGIVTLLPQYSDPISGTFADSMNDSGIVVGDSGGRAVLWQDGQIFDLNDLIPPDSGWILGDAMSINDAGDIVGGGTFDGVDTPFLLTPTGDGQFGISGAPEPASLALLALGSVVLFRRRRGGLARENVKGLR